MELDSEKESLGKNRERQVFLNKKGSTSLMSLSQINSLLAEQYNKYTNNYNIKQTTKHTQNRQQNTHKTNLQVTQTKYETH